MDFSGRYDGEVRILASAAQAEDPEDQVVLLEVEDETEDETGTMGVEVMAMERELEQFRKVLRGLPLWWALPERDLQEAEEHLLRLGGVKGLQEAAKEVVRAMDNLVGGSWLTAHALHTIGRCGTPEEVCEQLAWYGQAYDLLWEAKGAEAGVREGVDEALYEGDLDRARELLEL